MLVNGKEIIRVFPRRTKATPTDDTAYVGEPPLPGMQPPADEVHVSCTFTWDIQKAQRLAAAWSSQGYLVKLGGPAFGDPGGEFTPGLYLKEGYTITSRGCVNNCDHCLVPKREGPLWELEIKDGYDVVDNNLLACSKMHIDEVFAMLARQSRAARFTGGLEAARLHDWQAEQLAAMRLEILYLAYDRPEQWSSVERAIQTLRYHGIRQRAIGCYVLVGQPEDNLRDAEIRVRRVFDAGGMPYPMFYRGQNAKGKPPIEWRDFLRYWSRPALVFGGGKT